MKDGFMLSCPHCQGLLFIPLSYKAEHIQEMLRQRKAQKEGEGIATDGEPEEKLRDVA